MRATSACPARSARSARTVSFVSPLEEVESAFLALAADPWPLTLPARLFTDALAGGVLPVNRVRARLVHPSCTEDARTRVWAEVLARRAARREPWSTVAVGFTVPALRRLLARLPRFAEIEICELEQEVLTAVSAELNLLAVNEPQAGLRLVRAGDRAAHRRLYAAQRTRRTAPLPLDENSVPQPLPASGAAAMCAVLQRAVHEKVLTEAEAELIARTRVERQVMAKAAAAVGMSARSAFRHRAAAEERLAAALAAQDF
ncbi:hypothetical protein ACFQVC_12825 [Streptomyces monticola]|uniref:Sigma-70 family RNA polymerase sigma factor n=1 Tax=Streptomyces monticola TaxID=2666263 RepID=A0ABW2JI55_9ACTN